mmetsp:Transcript_167285/g.537339  ORF Transcript_167285/g.537339 Transcript_167285/m.537339 type:complete len:209 (+) Transcript_167285:232-858(+)
MRIGLAGSAKSSTWRPPRSANIAAVPAHRRRWRPAPRRVGTAGLDAAPGTSIGRTRKRRETIGTPTRRTSTSSGGRRKRAVRAATLLQKRPRLRRGRRQLWRGSGIRDRSAADRGAGRGKCWPTAFSGAVLPSVALSLALARLLRHRVDGLRRRSRMPASGGTGTSWQTLRFFCGRGLCPANHLHQLRQSSCGSVGSLRKLVAQASLG